MFGVLPSRFIYSPHQSTENHLSLEILSPGAKAVHGQLGGDLGELLLVTLEASSAHDETVGAELLQGGLVGEAYEAGERQDREECDKICVHSSVSPVVKGAGCFLLASSLGPLQEKSLYILSHNIIIVKHKLIFRLAQFAVYCNGKKATTMARKSLEDRRKRSLTANNTGSLSITIPVEMVRQLGWTRGKVVEVRRQGKKVVIEQV